MQFRLELSPAGVLKPIYDMKTVKMDLYNNMADLPNLVVEGFLYLLLLLYLLNEFRELYGIIKATGSPLGYFDFYNLLDWSVVICSYIAMYFRVTFYFMPAVRNFTPFSTSYEELSDAARYCRLRLLTF